ncbi:MAG: DUF2479 domain-containing protein [Alphaproteobacteria bacterium]|nr:DUF2479 domain-containing protein [Alphaproteobacteria bacterium]
MAVIATPTLVSQDVCAVGPSQSAVVPVNAVSCADQNKIGAPISAQNGQAVLTRMRAVNITQGQTATIKWQLHNKDGIPVDLSACEISTPENQLKVVFRMKEQIALGNQNPIQSLDATIVDAEKGEVEVALPETMVGIPGIYYGEMALVSHATEENAQPQVVFSNLFYVVINRGTFGTTVTPGGAPSIAEVRLHLRDSSPNESFLLENLMFDDAEIALAIARPVQYWNEIPPPLDQVYNTQNFPFRYHWLEGICANLFLMVAEQFRRNQLQYQAGGIAVDDQNKEANYERAGQTRWQAYRDWVRATKASINLEGCYGEVTSNYKYSAYTDAIRIRY